MVKESGTWKVYYIGRDYLGSITHVFKENGDLQQELSYDAWGRLRNPATQQVYALGSEPSLFLNRGYTGHEHLTAFGLINMNARLYDASLGRFLSPDPYVQDPTNRQNFNRYSYCLNNPLRYTDPSGEIIYIWDYDTNCYRDELGNSVDYSVVYRAMFQSGHFRPGGSMWDGTSYSGSYGYPSYVNERGGGSSPYSYNYNTKQYEDRSGNTVPWSNVSQWIDANYVKNTVIWTYFTYWDKTDPEGTAGSIGIDATPTTIRSIVGNSGLLRGGPFDGQYWGDIQTGKSYYMNYHTQKGKYKISAADLKQIKDYYSDISMKTTIGGGLGAVFSKYLSSAPGYAASVFTAYIGVYSTVAASQLGNIFDSYSLLNEQSIGQGIYGISNSFQVNLHNGCWGGSTTTHYYDAGSGTYLNSTVY